MGEPPLHAGQLIDSYCSRVVEPMDQASDDISILALVKTFSIMPWFSLSVKIISTDTKEDYLPEFTYSTDTVHNGVNFHMLFRPGHYDLVYQ